MSLKRLVCGINLRDLKKVVTALSKAGTHFNQNEMECLVKLFYSFKEKGNDQGIQEGLDRVEFRNILHNVFGMTDDMLMNRDCYRVYYLNGDGYISQDEMFDMLKNSLLKHSAEEDPEEGIKELVEITLKKMDCDNDGKLSYEDFERAVKKDRLLLEVFGPCLPKIEKCLEFETLVFKDINNEFQL
uniref:EF-hand calcium-binding domain-containing protein 1-like isoform X2 n=1 Tax=Phascolarctos cinereus TaxID=38626 RepID=A0A6P5KEI4_PHACI|nr:EF-hand calcium-binding domain-containing protein 1-like isoform X2 [Phascolarctos cinereus]